MGMTSDEDLFRAWRQGRGEALEILVGRYHAPLLAHLARLMGDAHLGEDLTQETFLRLVRDAHSYQYPRPFRPWLYAIARHLASNYYHSAYNRREETAATPPESVSGEPEPAAWLDRWEQRDELQAALKVLSFEHREVLSLRYKQELSVEEVASIVGVPAGTVKSRTFTALHCLRALLQSGDRADDMEGDRIRG